MLRYGSLSSHQEASFSVPLVLHLADFCFVLFNLRSALDLQDLVRPIPICPPKQSAPAKKVSQTHPRNITP